MTTNSITDYQIAVEGNKYSVTPASELDEVLAKRTLEHLQFNLANDDRTLRNSYNEETGVSSGSLKSNDEQANKELVSGKLKQTLVAVNSTHFYKGEVRQETTAPDSIVTEPQAVQLVEKAAAKVSRPVLQAQRSFS